VGGGFGAAALFGNVEKYASTITATAKNTQIAMISEAAMKRLMIREPDVAVAYIGFLSDRIRYLNSKIDSFASGNASCRLAKFLLAEAPCEVSMQRLSQILGISRVTLYREMEKLESAHAVERNGKYIRVTDKKILEKIL
jgi:CRP-like cAMP-binding protein